MLNGLNCFRLKKSLDLYYLLEHSRTQKRKQVWVFDFDDDDETVMLPKHKFLVVVDSYLVSHLSYLVNSSQI